MAMMKWSPKRAMEHPSIDSRAVRAVPDPARSTALVGLGGAALLRLEALIACGQHREALAALRALPPATPELPRLMGSLLVGMARSRAHRGLGALISELLERFPPRPEITQALVALAAILGEQGVLDEIFAATAAAMARSYGVDDDGLADLRRRLVHAGRRARVRLPRWTAAA